MNKIRVVIAGSTSNTRLCAQSLLDSDAFEVISFLTPSPKPIGRKKTITPNPIHQLAQEKNIPFVLIEKKIDDQIREQLTKLQFDILLVVDFGYIVPDWLLGLPKIGPINIHPSYLPKYRGSSPGQFALIFGEKETAVTLIRMDSKLDHGPIVSRILFNIADTWTSKDYYNHAFGLVSHELARLLQEYTNNPAKAEFQPDESPTITARMLQREDGYVPFETIEELIKTGRTTANIPFLTSIGLETNSENLYNLWRGLTPWPGLWTNIQKGHENIRVKLLTLEYTKGKLEVKEFQLEGKLPSTNVRELFN